MLRERVVKRDGNIHSIHLQNAVLSLWGVLFATTCMFMAEGKQVLKQGLFFNYTPLVVLMIATKVIAQYVASDLLKRCNSVTFVYTYTISLMVALIVKRAYDHLSLLYPNLVISLMLVLLSCVSYIADGPVLRSSTSRVFLGRSPSIET